MSLWRRIHHRVSRKQLGREALYNYIVAFVVIFLYLHFVGVKQYVPSFHREYLPVNSALVQAAFWALMAPVLWLLNDFILRDIELWRSFSGLDWQIQRLIIAGVVSMVVVTVVAWRLMLPFWGLAAAVALYMRFSRPKDSL
jgi:hypothetical protein